MDVRDLDVRLIDTINPFQSAYSILSKNVDEGTHPKIGRVWLSRTEPAAGFQPFGFDPLRVNCQPWKVGNFSLLKWGCGPQAIKT